MEDIDKIGYIIFSDGYDDNGNPVHKQEFVTYKSKCEELTKINQALKDRWESLKRLIATASMISTHTLNSTNNDKFKYYAEADDTILNNMQELEQGDMEQKIINRAKMLMFEQGKSINDAIDRKSVV